MKDVLVIAPHADDETLGCGGTILKYISRGYRVHWVVVTSINASSGYSIKQIEKRALEIKKVTSLYGFSSVHLLGFSPAELEITPMGDIIKSLSDVVINLKPEIVITAYRNDAHSDHEVVFDAVMSSTKTFRYPYVKKVLVYETLSETDFGMKPEDGGFRPNYFVNIESFIDKKIEIVRCYESEIEEFPFPRSVKAIRSLSFVRGVQCNAESAEAFMLIKEIQ